MAILRGQRTPLLLLGAVVGGPFVVAAWLALVRVAFRLFGIDVFP